MLQCVAEIMEEEAKGVDITLTGTVTARVSLPHFVPAIYRYRAWKVNN